MSARGGAFRIGIDTGGTFTDVVALNEATGEVFTTKTPTTVPDPSAGVVEAIRKVLEIAGGGGVTSVSHGTTVATNALLEERFPGLGLVTTEGFRHVLEIARQAVPRGYGNSYFWVKPERIVPLHRVREVPERMSFRGAVVRPLDEGAATEVARWFARHGIVNIGVSFIHGYANPAHEQRMRAILERECPGAHISISSEVLPEYREYERTVTTLVDAFVKSRVAVYVGAVQDTLDQRLGAGSPFYVMKSNGGVISAREVARQPITTILSGPAAGALGAAAVAAAAGFERVLAADVGGTSTDVCLVEDGAPGLTTEGTVGRFPVKVPMIDIVTVGSGGGSIAWLAPDGGLKVGPRSAGADPGPMCYGRGGDQPTATDAHLALGRIPPHLLGGEIPLAPEAAERGLARLGGALGLDPLRLAGRLLDLLSLRAALIPLSPANLSALGLLVVDVKNDYVQTCVQRHDRLDYAAVNAHLARLDALAREALHREGFAEEAMRLFRTADLRYFGQAWEVRVDLPPGAMDPTHGAETVKRFHDAHEKRFGYSYRDVGDSGGERHVVEWVNLRVTGVGPIRRPRFPERPRGDGRVQRALTGRRAVRFDGRSVECAVYARERLRPGDVVTGPAIVEEYGATTVVFPGLRAEVDRFGNLLLTRALAS